MLLRGTLPPKAGRWGYYFDRKSKKNTWESYNAQGENNQTEILLQKKYEYFIYIEKTKCQHIYYLLQHWSGTFSSPDDS